MRKVIRINTETGMYIEDVILQNGEATPDDCIETPCPDGFYHPKWSCGAWTEGFTKEELLEISTKKSKQTLTIEQMDGLLTFLFEGRTQV